MKLIIACCVLLASVSAVSAETLAFATDTRLNVSLRPNWEVAPPIPAQPGFPFTTVALKATGGRNAECLITVYTTNDKRASNLEFQRTLLIGDSAPWIKNLADKKMPAIQNLVGARVLGVYASFIDANLVGKPAKPGDYKIATACIMCVDRAYLVKTTILCDDSRGMDFSDAIAMVKSLAIARQ
jgi:hypothetical protein